MFVLGLGGDHFRPKRVRRLVPTSGIQIGLEFKKGRGSPLSLALSRQRVQRREEPRLRCGWDQTGFALGSKSEVAPAKGKRKRRKGSDKKTRSGGKRLPKAG